MKIGFWNIAGKNNSLLNDLIFSWSKIYDLDLILLLECKISNVRLLESLNRGGKSRYFWSPSPLFENSYFSVFTRLESSFSKPIKEEKRIQARNIIDPLFGNFTLILIHYQSKRNWDESDQNAHSSELKYFIDSVESEIEHDRTVVIGDFNMNPFQVGMVQTSGLHTTMDRRVAELGSRMVDGRTYKFFYNPMWSFFGEKGKGNVNGTYFYRSAKPVTYFWNIYDQVILRPSLIEVFDEDSLLILDQIGDKKLLNEQNVVNTDLSDHLPVVFELNLNKIYHEKLGEPLAQYDRKD